MILSAAAAADSGCFRHSRSRLWRWRLSPCPVLTRSAARRSVPRGSRGRVRARAMAIRADVGTASRARCAGPHGAAVRVACRLALQLKQNVTMAGWALAM